ncbi:MAG: hypothetical protein AB8B83_01860 [Bdellovibrionales bacterium]
MSIKSMFKKLNVSPSNYLALSLIAGGTTMSAVDIARLVNGDTSAAPALLQDFGSVAAGLGLLHQTHKLDNNTQYAIA